MFGTCVDGEAELLGMEGGRRMSIREQMTYPFTEGWKTMKERFGKADGAGELFGETQPVRAE
jgi:hypothetical protein